MSFDKFTDKARKVLVLAQEEARALHQPYVGTEHVLLALLKEKEGTAGRILEEFGVAEEALEKLINKLIAPSAEILVAERTPVYSPRARKLVELAVHEAEKEWLSVKFPIPLQVVKNNIMCNPCDFPSDFKVEK